MIKGIEKYYYFFGFLVVFLAISGTATAASSVDWITDGENIYPVNITSDNIPSAAISASPNPCSISQNQTLCSSTISWSTTNAPDACIFLKGNQRLFACGSSGSQNAPWITEQGVTFEVHLSNDINSQLLISVLVRGIKQTTVQHSLTVFKSGSGSGVVTAPGINCGSDCSETYDQGTSVVLTATPDSSSIFKNWSGDCSGTSNICALTIDSNKTAIANFEIKTIPSTSTCSTGPIIACIDSIFPNPVNQGQTITFTGSGKADDAGKQITKYRWRLDSVTGRTRICKAEESTICQTDTATIPAGIHTIYFRVGALKLLSLKTKWSNWIGKQFTVGSGTIPTVCGNNICELGENSGNCLQDCPVQPGPQCSDGIDNDDDSKIDYPDDPGCSSATDNDERDTSPPPPPPNIPTSPSNVKVAKNSNPTGYLVTWQDNSNNETSFIIERKVESGNWYYRDYVKNNVTKYIDISTNAVINTFRVRACNKNSCSSFVESNPINL